MLIRRAGRVVTNNGDPLDGPAAVSVRNGVVAWVGPDDRVPWTITDAPELDAGGACVLPGFVDPHTHALWAGSRRDEYAARLAGERYDGGGIASTVAATTAATDDELLELAAARLARMAANGTTTVEVKTGYGLDPAAELRLLGLVRRLAERTPLRVEPTLLAHVVPPGVDRAAHVAALAAALPAAKAAGARWIDVFCDRGAFTVEEARTLLAAGTSAGLGGRLHAEQLTRTGAAALAAECGCASADHLEHVDEPGAKAMAAAGVTGVLLPTATLSTGGSWDNARILRDAGVTLALGTDCNPGTSWCESVPYALQLAAPLLGLSVSEAIRAATVGGAAALRRPDLGVLKLNAPGDLVVLEAEHEADLLAHLGAPAVRTTIVGGVPVSGARTIH
ncbi:MAG TPA: imidazolonepropionase [Mycobacteriales bacterium]|nr:imidazolonepropionase [Mycobacteriales bacterium]